MSIEYPQSPINIFEYFDYRRYLKDYYKAKKALNRHFSYRSFAKKAGFNSSGFYSDVVKGARNLTERLIPRFSLALDHNRKEALYFKLMVEFTHANTPGAKQDVFERMVQLLPLHIQRVQQDQKSYFTRYIHVAVREALAVLPVKENYRELASFLAPPITTAEARESIRTLNSLGLISKDENGFWKATHLSLSADATESGAFLIREFQSKMIRLADEALERVQPELRDISTTTMSISSEGMERIQNKIKAFHKEIVEIVQSDSREDRVFQFNVQFFPLTRIQAEKKV